MPYCQICAIHTDIYYPRLLIYYYVVSTKRVKHKCESEAFTFSKLKRDYFGIKIKVENYNTMFTWCHSRQTLSVMTI